MFESKGAKLRAGKVGDFGKQLMEEAIAEVNGQLKSNVPFLLYGNVCYQQRSIGFFANPEDTYGYFYSGVVAKSNPLGKSTQALIDYVNRMFQSKFNAILVNRYDDGNNYISPHSDNEAGLDANAGVVILSAGATRTMRFKKAKKATSAIAFTKGYDMPLEDGSIVAMQGPQFQTSYTHEITKEKKVSGTRWSFTFRRHIPGIDESRKIAKANDTMAQIAPHIQETGSVLQVWRRAESRSVQTQPGDRRPRSESRRVF